MRAIDIQNVKRIVFWNPRVDLSAGDRDAEIVLVQEDEVFVVIEFPSREALDRFRAQVADI
jgi:hypothetical protein